MKAKRKPARRRFSAEVISLDEFRRWRVARPPAAPAAAVSPADGTQGFYFRWLALAGAWWTWWW